MQKNVRISERLLAQYSLEVAMMAMRVLERAAEKRRRRRTA